MTVEEMIKYDRMVELGIATAEEINLIKYISNGSWSEVFNIIVYVRTGYKTFEDYENYLMEEE